MISGLIVVVPLLGAGLLWLLREREARVHWGGSVGLSALILLIVSLFAGRLPAEFVLSTWRPPALFQAQLHLIFDRASWSFIFAATVSVFSHFLTSASRPGRSGATTRAMAIVYYGLTAAALMAGNTVTVALSWALVDATSFLFLLSAAQDYETVDGLTKRFGLQAMSVLLIVASSFPIAALRGDVESTVRPSLMAAAVFFRLGLFPLNIGLPAMPGIRQELGHLADVFPAAMGLAVLSRQLPSATSSGLQVVLLLLGGVSAAIGGFRWATAAGSEESRPSLVLTFAGLAAAVGALGGAGRMAVVGLGTLLLLVGSTPVDLEIHQRWHRGVGYAAALVAVGLPPTAGHLMVRLVGEPPWLPNALPLLVITLMGLLLMPAGTLRLARQPRSPWESGEPLVRAAYGLGSVLPLAAAVPTGIMLRAWPTTVSGLHSALLLVLGLAAGYAAARWSLQSVARALARVFRLVEVVPKLLGGLWQGGLHRSAALMRGLGRILEGRAAMLWVYVIILFVVAVTIGGGE